MCDGSVTLRPPGRSSFVIIPLRCRTGALLAGDADYTVRDTLRAALAALAADGARDVHLDLAELSFMDVCCTRELIAFAGRHPAARLVVHRPPASLRRIAALICPEAEIEFTDTPGTGEAAPTPDIMELILGEHNRISKLIRELDAALLDPGPVAPGSEPEPELAWAALARFLIFHLDAAEEVTYRALAVAGPGAAAAVRQASEADADIRAAVEEARLSRAGSLPWRMAVEAASRAARRHIVLLESGPLPGYRDHAAPGARRVLGRQWEAFMTDLVLDASGRPAVARTYPAHGGLRRATVP
jgi:anti-anti-sigma regulatory factor